MFITLNRDQITAKDQQVTNTISRLYFVPTRMYKMPITNTKFEFSSISRKREMSFTAVHLKDYEVLKYSFSNKMKFES